MRSFPHITKNIIFKIYKLVSRTAIYTHNYKHPIHLIQTNQIFICLIHISHTKRYLLCLLIKFCINKMVRSVFDEMRRAQNADGPATILAIGTATPPNCYLQSEYPDYYFRVNNIEHKTDLKKKFKRICKSIPNLL